MSDTQTPEHHEVGGDQPLLVTYTEACSMLSISVPVLRRAIRLGQLTCVQAPGTTGDRGKRILRRSIDEYLTSQIPSRASLRSSA